MYNPTPILGFDFGEFAGIFSCDAPPAVGCDFGESTGFFSCDPLVVRQSWQQFLGGGSSAAKSSELQRLRIVSSDSMLVIVRRSSAFPFFSFLVNLARSRVLLW